MRRPLYKQLDFGRLSAHNCKNNDSSPEDPDS
jgi:hypothetical protein